MKKIHRPVPGRLAALASGLLLAALVLATLSCGEAKEAAPSAPVGVRVETVRRQAVPQTVEAVGVLHGAREAVLAGKVMGRVIEIRALPGEAVRRGQILVVLDSRDVEGQIGSAEGALAQARAAASLAAANLARFEQLHQRGSASALELDQARYQHETAQGAVQQAEGSLSAARSVKSYAEIAAPFDGRVVDRLCEIGDLAAPGQPLLRIEDVERMRMHVWLGAGQSTTVGTEVRVEIAPHRDRNLRGRVAEVVPAADASTHTTLVKIDLEGAPGLRSGLFGRASFPVDAREVVTVPRDALRVRGGLTGVFVVEEGRANLRWLSVNDRPGEAVEVLAGLTDGESIVIDPPGELAIGSPVEVLP